MEAIYVYTRINASFIIISIHSFNLKLLYYSFIFIMHTFLKYNFKIIIRKKKLLSKVTLLYV